MGSATDVWEGFRHSFVFSGLVFGVLVMNALQEQKQSETKNKKVLSGIYSQRIISRDDIPSVPISGKAILLLDRSSPQMFLQKKHR